MTLTLFAEAASSASSAFGASDQAYLFQARQMQALSFTAHIPLVCFGVAFPAFVVFVEWLHLRTGDDVYRVLARRWSKVMLALFAVGVVTGTILSFEMGLLWPNFMATFGDVFGLGFTIEGISFFVEAIFIGIYVYGWDRLSPRTHLLTGVPIILSGFSGSLMVIAVNGWMNHPTGFTLENGHAVDVHPWAALFENSYFWHELIHMYIAAFMVAGFLTASAYAWPILRGRTSRYNRTALIVPLTIAALAAPVQIVVGDWVARDVAKTQPVKLAALEGLAKTQKGAPEHLLGWYDGDGVEYGIKIPKLLSLLAFHDPNATVQGLDTVPVEDQPPVNVVRFSFQTMVAIGTGLALLGVVFLAAWFRLRRLPATPLVLPRRAGRRPGLGRRAAGRLDHDGGGPPALGRLPRDAHLGSSHGRERDPGRLRDARARLRRARGRRRLAAATPRARTLGAAGAERGAGRRGWSA